MEIKNRTYVVGVFPNPLSVIRLMGSVLLEITGEWQGTRRYLSHEPMWKLMDPDPVFVTEPALFRLSPVNVEEISRIVEAEEMHRNYASD